MRRFAWLLLALAVGVLGLVALDLASLPMYHFNDCEKGLGAHLAECADSLLEERGGGYVWALLSPAALCAMPVVMPRRAVEWGTAGALGIGALVAFATVGGGAVLLISTAVLGVVLAASHGRLAGANPAAADIDGTEFFDRLREREWEH